MIARKPLPFVALAIPLTAALALLSMTGAALAQQQPGGGGAGLSPQQSTGGAIGRMTADQSNWRFESEAERQQHEAETREDAVARFGTERVELADRVQALIDQGQCREARALANAEGDRNMALRVRQTCRPRR